MVRSRLFLAAALLLSACGGSSKKEPPPDTTPPAVANPQNTGAAKGDKLVVRFSEPVHAVAATAVNAFDAGGATLASTAAFLPDGSLEVTPAAPLPVPGPVEVRVENVADAAGNLLARGSAFFRVAGWVDMAFPSPAVWGPNVGPPHEVARLAGATHLAWSGARAWHDAGGWSAPVAGGYFQSLVPGGGRLLHFTHSGASGVVEAVDAGGVTTISPVLQAELLDSSLAGCGPDGGSGALLGWMTVVGSPRGHVEVRASRLSAGAWIDLGIPAGAGVGSSDPKVACTPTGYALLAFGQFLGSCPGSCVRVLRRAEADADWTEIRSAPGFSPALAMAGRVPILAYVDTAGLRVEWQGPAGWADLGSPQVDLARSPADLALAVDAAGAPHLAWVELAGQDYTQAWVYVAARRGPGWALLGKGPVNDEVPFASGRRPRIAVGDDGVLVVAYIEWSGQGDPRYEQNHVIRVKRFAE
jgi:hypothetical protein